MKPLREMLPDGRLERTQDFLCQLDPRVAVADGRVFATSMSFNLYALDGGGKKLWRRDHGDVLRGLTLLRANGAAKPSIAVGGEDGRVAVYGSDGTPQGEAKIGGPVIQLSGIDLDGGGGQSAEFLGALGRAPDGGVLQLAADLF